MSTEISKSRSVQHPALRRERKLVSLRTPSYVESLMREIKDAQQLAKIKQHLVKIGSIRKHRGKGYTMGLIIRILTGTQEQINIAPERKMNQKQIETLAFDIISEASHLYLDELALICKNGLRCRYTERAVYGRFDANVFWEWYRGYMSSDRKELCQASRDQPDGKKVERTPEEKQRIKEKMRAVRNKLVAKKASRNEESSREKRKKISFDGYLEEHFEDPEQMKKELHAAWLNADSAPDFSGEKEDYKDQYLNNREADFLISVGAWR